MRVGAIKIAKMTKVIRACSAFDDLRHCGQDPLAIRLRPMEAIATITLIAAATCGFALVGILWRAAERADEAVEMPVQR